MKYYSNQTLTYIAISLSLCAWQPVSAQDLVDDELYPYAILQEGQYRYELTELTCAKLAQLQRTGYPLDEKGIARWLDEHNIQHPGTRSFTRYTSSAYDDSGCYEISPEGVHIYMQGSTQHLVQAQIIPCRQELLKNGGSCVSPRNSSTPTPVVPSQIQNNTVDRGDGVVAPQPPPEDIFAPKPSQEAGIRMIQFLLIQPYGHGARSFSFDDLPATLWQISCKDAAGFQMSAMSSIDYPFFRWLSKQAGKLLTVQRPDGAYQQSCYTETPNGLSVIGYQQTEPSIFNWR